MPKYPEEDYDDPVLRALELACKDLALSNNQTIDENVVMGYISKYLLDAVNEIARKIQEERYTVVIEKAGANYSAYIPDLPGCVSTGATLEEVKQMIQEAMEFHLEGLEQVRLKKGQNRPMT